MLDLQPLASQGSWYCWLAWGKDVLGECWIPGVSGWFGKREIFCPRKLKPSPGPRMCVSEVWRPSWGPLFISSGDLATNVDWLEVFQSSSTSSIRRGCISPSDRSTEDVHPILGVPYDSIWVIPWRLSYHDSFRRRKVVVIREVEKSVRVLDWRAEDDRFFPQLSFLVVMLPLKVRRGSQKKRRKREDR